AALPLGARDAARKDQVGDPLPDGALARMGSVRFRSVTTINSLAFAPDGKSLVTAGYANHLTFWDLATGKVTRTLTIPVTNVTALQYSRDGKVLALTCGDSTVRILDAATGAEKRSLQDPMRRYSTFVATLSPDGKTVVMSHRYDRQLLIWDAQT